MLLNLNVAVSSQVTTCLLTIEIDRADVLEEHTSLHGVHLVANAHVAGTQVNVHAVYGVGHGVHCVDHKLHLAFLFVR